MVARRPHRRSGRLRARGEHRATASPRTGAAARTGGPGRRRPGRPSQDGASASVYPPSGAGVPGAVRALPQGRALLSPGTGPAHQALEATPTRSS
ncbi:hypothetical protein BJY27_004869 [Streptomyces rapamycinicus]|uniref:Uncharacterized protein n=1 Tax=Streptomyces rapamycinicus TaxID=1226757 RepID=A0ABR6LNI5_9ACTN|nr:hypothetical protein [Streptomyces rapamycinicus]